MRRDATFIGVDIDDAITGDADIAAKLAEVCPVDIFAAGATGVDVVEDNLDECVLCKLCYDAAPDGAVKVHKLYADDAVL